MKTALFKNAKGYGYKYTDIAKIHEWLEENNLRYMQKIERIEGDDYIFTKICIDGEWQDEWIQGSRVVQATLTGIKNPAQEQGSALTYARRYSLLMCFGLATTDDDGAALTEDEKKKKLQLLNDFNQLVFEKDADIDKILKYYNVDTTKDLSIEQLEHAIKGMGGKKNETTTK